MHTKTYLADQVGNTEKVLLGVYPHFSSTAAKPVSPPSGESPISIYQLCEQPCSIKLDANATPGPVREPLLPPSPDATTTNQSVHASWSGPPNSCSIRNRTTIAGNELWTFCTRWIRGLFTLQPTLASTRCGRDGNGNGNWVII